MAKKKKNKYEWTLPGWNETYHPWDDRPAVGTPEKPDPADGPISSKWTTYQPIQLPKPAPTLTPPMIGAAGVVESPTDTLLGDGGLSVLPKAPPQEDNKETEEERLIRSINMGYFQSTGRFPSPSKVRLIIASLSDNNRLPGPDMSDGQYVRRFARMFEGSKRLVGEPKADFENGDYFKDTGYVELRGFAELAGVPKSDEWGGIQDTVPTEVLKETMGFLRGSKPEKTPLDYARVADPRAEMRGISYMLAERLRRRNAPVEWDVENPWKDPDFIRAAAIYMMGSQIAPTLWGSDSDKKISNKSIEWLRGLPISGNQWEQIGEPLGVGVADWSNKETFGLVIDAMRSTNNETVFKIAYDGWMMGRPLGMDAATARFNYATKFGAERLPAAERMKFEQSSRTIMGVMGITMEAGSDAWDWAKHAPVIGAVLHPIAPLIEKTTYGVNLPLQWLMTRLVQAYDVMAIQADPRRGLTLNEYQAALGRGEEFGNSSPWDLQWSVITDASRWSQAYQEAQGKTLISQIAQNLSLSSTGHVSPAAKDFGDLADLSVMFYLGAKVGDPIFRYGVRKVRTGTFAAGRFVEPVLYDSTSYLRRRYVVSPQRGEWLFHIPKEEIPKIPTGNVIRVEQLQQEARALIDANDPEANTPRLQEIADEVDQLKGPAKVTAESTGTQVEHPTSGTLWDDDRTGAMTKDEHAEWGQGRPEFRDLPEGTDIEWAPGKAGKLEPATIVGRLEDKGGIKYELEQANGKRVWTTATGIKEAYLRPEGAPVTPVAAPAAGAPVEAAVGERRLPNTQFTTAEEAAAEAQRLATEQGKPVHVQKVAKRDGSEAYNLRYSEPSSKAKLVSTHEPEAPAAGVMSGADRMRVSYEKKVGEGIEPQEAARQARAEESARIGEVEGGDVDDRLIDLDHRIAAAKQDAHRLELANRKPEVQAALEEANRLQGERDALSGPSVADAKKAVKVAKRKVTNAHKAVKANPATMKNAHLTKRLQDAQKELFKAEKDLYAAQKAANPAPDPEVAVHEDIRGIKNRVGTSVIPDEQVPVVAKLMRDEGLTVEEAVVVQVKKEYAAAKAEVKRLKIKHTAHGVTGEKPAGDSPGGYRDWTPEEVKALQRYDNAAVNYNDARYALEQATPDVEAPRRTAGFKKGDTVDFQGNVGVVVKKLDKPGMYKVKIKGKTVEVKLDRSNVHKEPKPDPPDAKPLVEKVDDAGVEVAEIDTVNGTITADTSAARGVQRCNEGGYKTLQSHGHPDDHPIGHPARNSEPYIEFVVYELDRIVKFRTAKITNIRKSAERAGCQVKNGKPTVGGEEHSSLIVTGDIDKFVDELMGKKLNYDQPVTIADWQKQLDVATNGQLTEGELGNLGALLATNARYAGVGANEFVAQRLAGVIHGNDPVHINGVMVDAATPEGALFARAIKKAGGQSAGPEFAKALEFYRREARSYLELNYPEMGEDIDVAVNYLTAIYKETTDSIRKGTGKTVRWNTKTLFSVDISTICPFAQKPCAMCFNYQLEGLANAKKAGTLRKGASRMAPKQFEQTPYNNEILEMPDSLVVYLNETQGGLRINSFGDWSPEVDARFVQLYEHAQQRGLTLKVITKQTEFIKKYGMREGITIQLSTDFDPAHIGRILELQRHITEPQRRVLQTLRNVGGSRTLLSHTLSLDDAYALAQQYDNVVIRYTAINPREALLAGADPRINVLTLYHSDITDPVKLRLVLEQMWGPPKDRLVDGKPTNYTPIREVIGENNLQAFADLFKPVTPNQMLTNAILKGEKALTGVERTRLQADIDMVFGKGKMDVDTWAKQFREKVCCVTGKCGTCEVKCSFGIRTDPDLLMALVDGVPTASVQFMADGRAVVRALDAPGPAEFTHEIGHIFRRTLNQEDAALMQEWAGLKVGDAWTVEAEEAFAQAFGEYFTEFVRTGTLETAAHLSIMQKFTVWLGELWNRIKGTPAEADVGDAAKALFDRFAKELAPEQAYVRSGPETPGGASLVPEDPLTPIRNAFFRTNAEVIAKADDPALIAAMYQIPESNTTLNRLVREAAAEQDPVKVEKLLKQMEEHGVEIDGGAGAVLKNMRLSAYRDGYAQRGTLRFFITPTIYGTTHGIDGSTEAAYNYMVASKLGMSKLDDAGWAQIRQLRRELWEEQRGLKKRNIVNKIDDIIEENIIREHGSMEAFEKYKGRYHKMQGKAIMTASRRAYYGVYDDTGKLVEGSVSRGPSRARSVVEHAVKREKAQVDALIEDATPEFKKKVEDAFANAEKDAAEVEKAISDIDRLGETPLNELTPAEKKTLKKAQTVIDSYGTKVPFKMGQAANHITFRHNPRILASYMAGETSQVAALIDQAIFQPLMTAFKETVMSALGFPIRVNIGDEYIRLIPEGTLGRMRQARAMKAQARAEGMWGDELDAAICDKLAYDWVASDSGDWILVDQFTSPRYFEYLAQDLRSWAREPIVQRLLEKNKGEFPDDVGDIHKFISEIAHEDSDLGIELRQYLDDTYRYEGGIDNDAFVEWTSQWQDRMDAIAANPTLRRSMTEQVDVATLKMNLRDEELWPVNAPEQMGIGFRPSLNMINYANPFHYIYQGIPIGGGRRAGALQLLGAMSNKLRETMFADRYYLERKAIGKQSPHLLETADGRLEIHNTAAERALAYTNKVTYSRSSTMFEDMTRNLIPFGNAYRQFWQYWLTTFAKHPISMSVYMENYDTGQQAVAGMAGAASSTANQANPFGEGSAPSTLWNTLTPEITMQDQFLGVGDYQFYVPPVPFLAVKDQEAGEGTLGTIRSNIPQAGFLITTGAKTLMGALGEDPNDYANLPGMAGMGKSMAPFGRQAKLLYGLFGWTLPGTTPQDGSSTTMMALFGDPAKFDKAHANAILAQLAYDPDTDSLMRHKPMGWRVTETLFSILPGNVKPEALFAEGWKIFVPSPASASYSPKVTRDKGNWMYEYYDKLDKGDSAGAAKLRSDHAWLDTYLTYYDSSYEDQIAMKRDPANLEMVKFWVSPYNYGRDGAPLEGMDWQNQFTSGKVSYKEEEDYVTAVNNLYVDIHGGTYMQSAYRQEGVTYLGDATREVAEKRTKAKMRNALSWAKKVAARGAKERGWDAAQLMYQFKNPGENWGIWPQLLKAYGLDPMQYNIEQIGKVFASKYGSEYKMVPQYLSGEQALRALDLSEFIADPALREEMLTATPFVNDITMAKKEQRKVVTTAIIQSATGQWYWLGSQQLNAVGIKSSKKLDLYQLELHSDYQHLQTLGVGSSEYKAARNAYYKKRDKLLGSVKGGEAISGGIADRLRAVPFVLTPQVTLMGTGRGAVAKQGGWNSFSQVIERELDKPDPNPAHLDAAYDKLVGFRKYSDRQRSELLRVSAWAYLIASAKHLRYQMLHHYSEYYESLGESSTAKYGKARVKELDRLVSDLRKFSPAFSTEIDDWFGSGAAIGSRFLNWYVY